MGENPIRSLPWTLRITRNGKRSLILRMCHGRAVTRNLYFDHASAPDPGALVLPSYCPFLQMPTAVLAAPLCFRHERTRYWDEVAINVTPTNRAMLTL